MERGARISFVVKSHLLYFFYRLLNLTLRYASFRYDYHLEALAGGKPILYLFWHEHIFPAVYLMRDKGLLTMASRSKDGDAIVFVLDKLGWKAVRGSTGKGGKQALVEMMEAIAGGERLCNLTVDGPLGPARVVKDGAARIALAHDIVILPFTFRYSRTHKLNSWDRFNIPVPFSAVSQVFGKPVKYFGGGKTIEEIKAEIQRSMAEIDAIAEGAT